MSRSPGIALWWGMLGAGLALAVGCAEVLGIEDWKKPIPPEGAGGGAPPPCAVCVAAPPDGWTGPVEFTETDGVLGDCSPPWELDWNGATDDAKEPATCHGCSCEFPPGICQRSQVLLYMDGECAEPQPKNIAPNLGCDEFTALPSPGTFTTASAQLTSGPGACLVTGGGVLSKPGQARACRAPGVASGMCDAAQVCVPELDRAYQLCIYRPGNQDCPAGYEMQRPAYTRVMEDSRECPTCECPLLPDCSPSTTTFYAESDAMCASPLATIPHDGMTCVNFNSVGHVMVRAWFRPAAGTSCKGDGKATGSAVIDPASSVTVCCKASS